MRSNSDPTSAVNRLWMRSITDQDFVSQNHVDAPLGHGILGDVSLHKRKVPRSWIGTYTKKDLTLWDGSITDQDSASQSHVDAPWHGGERMGTYCKRQDQIRFPWMATRLGDSRGFTHTGKVLSTERFNSLRHLSKVRCCYIGFARTPAIASQDLRDVGFHKRQVPRLGIGTYTKSKI